SDSPLCNSLKRKKRKIEQTRKFLRNDPKDFEKYSERFSKMFREFF
ncbi:hypothetical protein HMPREF1869_00141, partial [Bacteroidales bacterium KA00251]